MTGTPCKKCGSCFIYRETDQYGTYLMCGHCGQTNDSDTIPASIQETVFYQDLEEEEIERQAKIMKDLGIFTKEDAALFGLKLRQGARRRQPSMSRFQ